MNQNELAHVGVLGMRWGHRKAQAAPLKVSDKKRKMDESRANMKAVKKSSGRRSEEFKDAKSQYKKAAGNRNAAIASKAQKLYDDQSLFGKIMDNPTHRATVSRYVVDHNMPMEEARRRADRDTIAVTVALLAIYGGLSMVEYSMKG